MKSWLIRAILPTTLLFLLVVIHLVLLISEQGLCDCLLTHGELPRRFSNGFGTHPRSWSHFYTAFTGSWLHGSWEHLFGNVLSLAGLSALYLLFIRTGYLRFFVIQWVVSGVILFFVASAGSIHVGASTWSYSFAGFLSTLAFLHPNRKVLSLFFIICLWYGSMVWGILPIDPRISFQGHISGLITGVLIGLLGRDYWISRMGVPQFKPTYNTNEDHLPENPYNKFN